MAPRLIISELSHTKSMRRWGTIVLPDTHCRISLVLIICGGIFGLVLSSLYFRIANSHINIPQVVDLISFRRHSIDTKPTWKKGVVHFLYPKEVLWESRRHLGPCIFRYANRSVAKTLASRVLRIRPTIGKLVLDRQINGMDTISDGRRWIVQFSRHMRQVHIALQASVMETRSEILRTISPLMSVDFNWVWSRHREEGETAFIELVKCFPKESVEQTEARIPCVYTRIPPVLQYRKSGCDEYRVAWKGDEACRQYMKHFLSALES